MARGHARFKENLADMQTALADWMEKSVHSYKFWSLDQWNEQTVQALQKEGRPALTIDRTRPILQGIIGQQITSRFQSVLLPRDHYLGSTDRSMANSSSKVQKWAQQKGDYEQVESLAFQDTLVTGVGAIEMFISFDVDPDGRILIARVPWGMIGWDPSSTQPNMEDATYIIRGKWLDLDEAISAFGEEQTEMILGQASREDDRPTSEIRESRTPYGIFAKSDMPSYNRRRNEVFVWEKQCFEKYYATRIIAPDIEQNRDGVAMAAQQGQTIPRVEMFADASAAANVVKRLSMRIQSLNYELSGQPTTPIPMPTYLERFPRRVYYKSFHTRNDELQEITLPHTQFTYLFITAFEDWSKEEIRQFMGPMRQMEDPQTLSNKSLSQMVHIFTANPKGAIIYEKRLFNNPATAAQQWALATGMIEANDGMLSNPRMKEPFRHLTTQTSLRGIENILGIATSSVPAAVGLSEAAFLGQAQDIRRISGEALSSLLGQQMKTQTVPFDSLRLYRKQMGRLLFSFVQNYMSEETLLRILDPERDAVFLQSFRDENLLDEYDIVVEEAPSSPTERQQSFQIMAESQFLTSMQSMGIPLPPGLADMFPGLDQETASQFKVVLQKAYEIQLLGMELQKRQMETQLSAPPTPQAPGGPGSNGAGPQPGGQPPPDSGGGAESAPPTVQ